MRLEPTYDTISVRGEPMRVRTNVPMATLIDLQSGKGEAILTALRMLVVEHTFTVEGPDGADIPATVEDFDSVLVGEITEAWAEKLKGLPKRGG